MVPRQAVCATSVAAILLVSSLATASSVSVDSTVSGTPGAYIYNYEIENQSPVNLLAFSLVFSGDFTDILSPNGWVVGTGSPAPGENLIQWFSTDVPFDVTAFGTLAGFGFKSASGPGAVSFSILDDDFNEFDGQATGPIASATSVPEPASLILLGTGLIVGLRRWRRNRDDLG